MQDASKKIRVGLLGASFDTGNLGVSALAESSIQCILHEWPEAKIDLLASGRTFEKYTLEVEGKAVEVENLPVRCPALSGSDVAKI